MELQAMMAAISAAFLDPLKAAMAGVPDVALPLVHAAIPLVAGVHLLRSAAGAQLPIGTLLHSFLTIGIAQAAITLWPTVISGTLDQVDLLGGLAGSETTDPFEIVTAGAALATLAFDHAGAVTGYMSGWIIGGLFTIAGIAIFAAYTLVSAFSLMAWVQYWTSRCYPGASHRISSDFWFQSKRLRPLELSHQLDDAHRGAVPGLKLRHGSPFRIRPAWHRRGSRVDPRVHRRRAGGCDALAGMAGELADRRNA